MNNKKSSQYFEEYPIFTEDHPTMIRPQVFGARSKFGEVVDNGRMNKVEGRYRYQVGDAISLRATGYWLLMQAMLRELRMSGRDRFMLNAHVEGRSAKQINRMLPENGYKPYRKSKFVNERIGDLIRKYYLTPKSELNLWSR